MPRYALPFAVFIAAALPGAAFATQYTTPPSTVTVVAQDGFEQPPLPTGQSQVDAIAGANWQFMKAGLDKSGIASNGSPYNNPAAPEGQQVGLVQRKGTASWTFSVPSDGRYRLAFKAAQRLTNAQRATVSIDGAPIGEIAPTDATFRAVEFDALSLTAGAHTLTFAGLRGPEDHTLFVDDVSVSQVVLNAWRWSNPATWGALPDPDGDDDIVVPAGSVLLLDAPNVVVRSIVVHGELHCADSNLKLAAESIMVHGRFVCGSPSSPYVHKFILTLNGAVRALGGEMGHKVLGAMSGGVIELHGRQRTSWTQLDGTVAANTSQLRVATPTDWGIGDRIVIAPTNAATNESEVASIAAISDNGRQITLDRTLQWRHYGATSTYTNGTDTWTLDERGEVGLLTRNITIQGDGFSTDEGFGGHVMTMGGSSIRASGIELYRMGQLGFKARYPFHWHLVGDAPGQYIRNSSIHESYNRCVTVHQTNYALVADNVCHDFVGHGYFLEDGNEQHNVFDRNLGIGAKRPAIPDPLPAPGDLPLETDYREAAASNGPAVFWISHPNNTYTNNVAAGSQGSGFWYRAEDTTVNGIPPSNAAPFGKFDNNRAHSSRQGFTACRDAGGVRGLDAPGALFERLTVANVGQGVWPCASNPFRQNATFSQMIVANTENGMQAPSPATFRDSLFVAYSANEPPRASDLDVPWRGIAIYDQGFHLDNVHFVNYDRPQMSALLAGEGSGKLPTNRIEGVTFENSPNRFVDLMDFVRVGGSPSQWGEVIHDLDGSLVPAGQAIVTRHPLLYDGHCTRPPAGAGVEGYACPYRYAHYRMEFSTPTPMPPFQWPRITQMRSDGVGDTTANMPLRYIVPFMAAGPQTYTNAYRFDAGIARNDLAVAVFGAFDGDTSIHEIMDVPGTFEIDTPGWTRVYDRADLALPGNRYYYASNMGSLALKFDADGVDWHALGAVHICMVPKSELPLGVCNGARTATPPEIEISEILSTPQEHYLVIASAAAPTSIVKTFLFDGVTQIASDEVAPFAYDVLLSPGVHVLRLVAFDAAGQSYTAFRRFDAGSVGERVDITSIAPAGTYTANNIPPLQFSITGNVPPGTHVHYIEDGVDQGHVADAGVSLNHLDQGRHDLEIALAAADHTVRAIVDRRTIYVVADGLIADFEDGVDRRASFVPVINRTTPFTVYYGNGVPRTGRADIA
ncbi:MAG TPA: G8 domain-containing protein, partial [Tahibacter sp.]|nr:G8 domain-containing protein [Tahibacter sp.]